MNQRKAPVDARTYDKEYFCEECEGYEDFMASGGREPSKRLKVALSHADVQPGMRVLDVGCGRGEGLVWLMNAGAEAWGLDYATAALELAAEAVNEIAPEGGVCELLVGNARRLPLPTASFHRVIMLDVVEHLHPWELEQALAEIHRILERGGKLVIHTAPNLWYYHWGYPLYRLFERLRGIRLPRDPRQRFRYHQHVHVNEQTPRSLSRVLRKSGFRTRVWLADIQQRWAGDSALKTTLGWLVTHLYPFRWIFCGDILAEAYKA